MMSEFGALQNCLAVMELANIELKQQNRDLRAALEAITNTEATLDVRTPIYNREAIREMKSIADKALDKVGE